MKRFVIMAVAAIMTLTLLVGCANQAEPDLAASTPQPSASASSASAQNTGASTPQPSAEPEPAYDYAKISWFWNASQIQCPPDAYPFQKMLEEINVELVPINPQGSEYETILLTRISSGDSPDVIMTYDTLTTSLIGENLIVPVDEYLNEQYLPNLIRISRDWDPALDTLRRSDGRIWEVPSLRNNALPEQTDWIRKDWLDKVGMEIPTSYEELTQVLLAFAGAEDLNGDGITTYPMLANTFWGISYLFEAFAANDRWYPGEDGLPEIGLLTPRAKDVLRYIKNLIDNNALSPDLQTTNYDDVTAKIQAGVVGYHHGWSGYDALDLMKEVYPDADWVPFMPPKGILDQGYATTERTTRYDNNRYVVSVTCKDIEAAMRAMDWLCVDTATSTEPGRMTYEGSYWTQFGERGINWDVVDGRFVNGGTFEPDQALADKFTAQNESDRWADFAVRRFSNQFDTRWMGSTERDQQLATFRAGIPTGDMIPADSPYLQRSWLVPIEDPAYSAFMNAYPYWDNEGKFAEILGYNAILGKGDIDALFEEFLAECNANGYQELRRLVADHMAANPFAY